VIIGIDASRVVAGQRTGTEAYARFLIEALLPPAAEAGHQVRLYYNLAPNRPIFSAPHEAVVIPWPRLWSHLRLAWELHRRPPDVFFTPAHVIPWSWRGPSVATIHDLGYERFPAAHPRRQLAYLRWSTRHNARRARLVIADSYATSADLQQFYATDPARIHVVWPGRDPAVQPVHDPALIAAAAARFGITAPWLLYIGTLQPRKNLARLVQAFGQVAAEIPHTLVLAGKAGWLPQPLEAALAALPPDVRRRVILTGFVSEEEKVALLSGATALLYPSLHEGFGFPLLEGQACGVAVVSADNSSLPEVAGDGALLVDAGDSAALAHAMRRIATDPALRARLIAAGRHNLTRFDWSRAARQVLTLLEQVHEQHVRKSESRL
jgi:glycosyltransferase involved in cell wall biosynthesis